MLETLTPFTLYMIMQADKIGGTISGLLFFLCLASIGGVFLFGVGTSIYNDALQGNENKPTQQKKEEDTGALLKRMGVAIWVCTLLVLPMRALTPSTQTLLVAYGVPAAIQTINEADQIKAIGGKSLSAINKVLDGYLQEEK